MHVHSGLLLLLEPHMHKHTLKEGEDAAEVSENRSARHMPARVAELSSGMPARIASYSCVFVFLCL